MRVAHLCLSCFFIDGVLYQENELVRQHLNDGHDVLVIASTETHSQEGKITYIPAGDYVGSEGARVVRLPYVGWLPHAVARKMRINPGVGRLLRSFQPDTIVFHGTCGWEILTVAKYVKENPSVKFYVDSHEDWNNSARNFVSREVLHKNYYGRLLRNAMPQIDKILCVSTEAMAFVGECYRIPRDRLEFFPLGGRPVPENEYNNRRTVTRADYDISNEDILFVQSGKQTRRKRLIETLEALSKNPDPRFRFLVAGVLQEDIRQQAIQLIAGDNRVKFVGWKTADQLTDLLCAADVYLQPGTQSASMQHSLCCRCAVILDDVPAHLIYQRENGWFVGKGQSLEDAFAQVRSADLDSMKLNSYAIACEMLDYSVLSRRVLR